LKNWLYRIAYHKFIDFKRKSTREIDLNSDCEQNVGLFSKAPDPINKLINDESLTDMYEAVTKLDLSDYSVMVMHYIEGLSFNDMARILNEPVGTVKARTSRALTRLKAILPERE
jgi:RNA polymerase sigma-70 factor, ECF subfamily